MSVLTRFCLIDGIQESFNIKVEKGNVLMRNLKGSGWNSGLF